MRVIEGDIWKHVDSADLFCLTTNASINRDGTLAMGRGIAAEAAKRWMGLRRFAGEAVRAAGDSYGLIILDDYYSRPKRFGLFQTKGDWRKPAVPRLIMRAAAMLSEQAQAHPEWEIVLPMPGVGEGKLQEEVVLPLLGDLPDNVLVFRR